MLGSLCAVGCDKACLDGEYQKATSAHMKGIDKIFRKFRNGNKLLSRSSCSLGSSL